MPFIFQLPPTKNLRPILADLAETSKEEEEEFTSTWSGGSRTRSEQGRKERGLEAWATAREEGTGRHERRRRSRRRPSGRGGGPGGQRLLLPGKERSSLALAVGRGYPKGSVSTYLV